MAAIYQQARPATFAEVVGQEHVKDVLVAGLRQGRASHAYLFSGPRGVGKTTTARLLAMSLNCEAAEGDRPCGQCDSCRMVREGNHPDVIELDAASNNSVDDIRELREKTSLASMRGGSRVWILDEAHMLSKAAANALLKTLEEPPPGLVFILATTEPEKLPPTVLSRCQHFRFRRLSESEILGKLQRLCEGAQVEAEPEALALVARAADGAMRDAESLLDRLLTSGEAIDLRSAEEALGLPPQHRIRELAGSLVAQDLAALFSGAESLYRDGFAPRSLAQNLGVVLRDALRQQVLGDEAGPSTQDGFTLELERNDLLRLIHALDEEQERFIRRDDLYSLEVALLKCVNVLAGGVAVAQAGEVAAETTTGAASSPGKAASSGGAKGSGESAGRSNAADELPPFEPVGRSGTKPLPAKRTAAVNRGGGNGAGAAGSQTGGDSGAGSARGGRGRFDWHAVRSAASAQLKAFLMPARERLDGDTVVVSYEETHKFHHSQLVQRKGELESLIEQVAGPGYRLRIEGPGEPTTKKS